MTGGRHDGRRYGAALISRGGDACRVPPGPVLFGSGARSPALLAFRAADGMPALRYARLLGDDQNRCLVTEPEELEQTAASPTSGGFSASGWAAVAALGAAAITGAVTLMTHFLPPPEAHDQQSGAAGSSTGGGSKATAAESSPRVDTPTPSSGAAPRSALLQKVAGTWAGPAQSGSQRFTMTLLITSTCVEGGPCGTLTTDLLPCVGNITLVKIDDGPALDFATGSFSSDSSSSCELRIDGGDYFRVGDDVLSYATGYDGGLRGTLYRVR